MRIEYKRDFEWGGWSSTLSVHLIGIVTGKQPIIGVEDNCTVYHQITLALWIDVPMLVVAFPNILPTSPPGLAATVAATGIADIDVGWFIPDIELPYH